MSRSLFLTPSPPLKKGRPHQTKLFTRKTDWLSDDSDAVGGAPNYKLQSLQLTLYIKKRKKKKTETMLTTTLYIVHQRCSHTITNYKVAITWYTHTHTQNVQQSPVSTMKATVLTSATDDSDCSSKKIQKLTCDGRLLRCRWWEAATVQRGHGDWNRLGRTSTSATGGGNGRSYRQANGACDGRPTLDGGVAERAGDARRPARRCPPPGRTWLRCLERVGLRSAAKARCRTPELGEWPWPQKAACRPGRSWPRPPWSHRPATPVPLEGIPTRGPPVPPNPRTVERWPGPASVARRRLPKWPGVGPSQTHHDVPLQPLARCTECRHGGPGLAGDTGAVPWPHALPPSRGKQSAQIGTSTSSNSVSSVLPPSDREDTEVSDVLRPAGWIPQKGSDDRRGAAGGGWKVDAAVGEAYPDAVAVVGWRTSGWRVRRGPRLPCRWNTAKRRRLVSSSGRTINTSVAAGPLPRTSSTPWRTMRWRRKARGDGATYWHIWPSLPLSGHWCGYVAYSTGTYYAVNTKQDKRRNLWWLLYY